MEITASVAVRTGQAGIDIDTAGDGWCPNALERECTTMNQEFSASNRDEWRAWLEKNHHKTDEVWLVYFKKHTGMK